MDAITDAHLELLIELRKHLDHANLVRARLDRLLGLATPSDTRVKPACVTNTSEQKDGRTGKGRR
jgi:hypothetical protein